ncbi:hypothetical protein GQX74_004122 [Glossina fuscipes]|nr:hypothetical protein GQX74_004122 [Glossina fuscipes]
MYDAVEKAEIINGKKIIRISNIGDTFGRAKQVLIDVQTSLATCLIKAIKIKIRGREAQSLMAHTANEENTDWVLLSDAYIKPQTAASFQHGKGKADIHITNTNLQLEATDENVSSPVIFARDFNSKSLECYSNTSDRRSITVREMIASLDLDVPNGGSTSTFQRAIQGTVKDVTIVSLMLSDRCTH